MSRRAVWRAALLVCVSNCFEIMIEYFIHVVVQFNERYSNIYPRYSGHKYVYLAVMSAEFSKDNDSSAAGCSLITAHTEALNCRQW